MLRPQLLEVKNVGLIYEMRIDTCSFKSSIPVKVPHVNETFGSYQSILAKVRSRYRLSPVLRLDLTILWCEAYSVFGSIICLSVIRLGVKNHECNFVGLFSQKIKTAIYEAPTVPSEKLSQNSRGKAVYAILVEIRWGRQKTVMAFCRLSLKKCKTRGR